MERDTVSLLRECNAGIKMGILSMDEILEYVDDLKLQKLILDSREAHCRLEKNAGEFLDRLDCGEKEPPAMARLMSWIKTNVKLTGDDSDRTIADLLTDGCNMGVKTLNRYLHQYPEAEDAAVRLVEKVICEEEALAKDLQPYL